jgi:hypothetical protein
MENSGQTSVQFNILQVKAPSPPQHRHKPLLKQPNAPLFPLLGRISKEVAIAAIDLNVEELYQVTRSHQVCEQHGVGDRNTQPPLGTLDAHVHRVKQLLTRALQIRDAGTAQLGQPFMPVRRGMQQGRACGIAWLAQVGGRK